MKNLEYAREFKFASKVMRSENMSSSVILEFIFRNDHHMGIMHIGYKYFRDYY